VPRIVDYVGRFAFFELASFTLVRDHGVDRLSRHALAKVLATSVSTIRRLLSPEADLRQLALNEVAYRRRLRLTPAAGATGPDAGARLLMPLIPTVPEQVAEELVWWRLVIATSDDGEADVVVAARQVHDEDLADRLHTVVRVTAPRLTPPAVDHHAQVLHAVVDGLRVAVSLGRLSPDEAASLARAHVATIALSAPR